MFGFFKKKNSANNVENNVVSRAADDTALQSYKKQAQDEISYLIEFMASHEKNDELFQYAVKTNFIEDGRSEHMWVQVSEFIDGKFIGRLANEPNTIKSIKYGDVTQVNKEDVEDWILADHFTNTQVGGFSTQYLRADEGKK